MDEVAHVLTDLLEPFVRPEARLGIRSEGMVIITVNGQTNASRAFSPETIQE